ncbi:MAG: VOC family protein [Bacteroidota bacterium]
MKKINRILTNICAEKLQESKVFYTKLFDFDVDFESNWFIHLISADKQLELGIIDRKNEIVPQEVQHQPQGFYITFVVDDVDVLFEVAKAENFEIVEPPKDTFYGQRRLLLKDPEGTIVDISAPMPNFEF